MNEFDQLLAQLNDPDPKVQETAIKLLSQWQPTPSQGAILIEAAGRTYPNDSERHEPIGEQLLDPVSKHADSSYIAHIKQHYGALSQDKRKQWQSLRILTELKTSESLAVFVDLLGRPESRSMSLEMPLVPLIGSFWGGRDPIPAMAAMFPAWFDLAEHLEDLPRYYTVISNCQAAGLVDLGAHPRFVSDCIQRARRDLAVLQDAGAGGPAAGASNEGLTPAARAALELEWIIDLFRAMDHPEIPDIVVQALEAPEDHVRLFAIGAALRRGIDVPEEKLVTLAAKPARRYKLWRLLDSIERLDRFPEQYRTTQLLAETNMVRWLEFPTELGRAPEEIEHLTVIESVDRGGRRTESHFFKFRHSKSHEGKWLVGFAGMYWPDEGLQLEGSGTFSKFRELDSKSLEEHVADYLKAEEAGIAETERQREANAMDAVLKLLGSFGQGK